MRRLGEIALIAEYLAPLATSRGSFGLKDDAALLAGLPSTGLAVTADALVAGVHFFESDDPADVAYKALAVNVSDLAAKGAKPLGYVMTLAPSEAPTEDWARRLSSGLARAQDAFGMSLFGGDTVTARGAWWLSITAFGEAPARGLVPRSGAKAGDYLYVSGTLGDSALGLKLRRGQLQADLSPEDTQFLLRRYLYPEPRLALASALTAYASAAMDISDGLALDLSRMCAASGVSAQVYVPQIPLSGAARQVLAAKREEIQTILSGGDDYEILAAVPAPEVSAFEKASTEAGIPIAWIGTVLSGSEPPNFLDADGSRLTIASGGFEHFKT
jgi:thiamine-monophosphate kinase